MPTSSVREISSSEQDIRFGFGNNWKSYASLISAQQVEDASRRLNDLIDIVPINGKSFLDIGCGSGLHSLAALQSGAISLFAIDYDPVSVATSLSVLERFLPGDARYTVKKGDILDQNIHLPSADIVYSWGVLHHTGNLNQAIVNTAQLVNKEGLLVLALYGKTRYCGIWTRIKRWYCLADDRKKKQAEGWYVRLFGWYLLLRGKHLKDHIDNYSKKRGMDFFHDVKDWLGGYPYESVSPSEIKQLVEPLGFHCVKQNVHRRSGLFGSGCDEYIFKRLA